jgi:tRNA nucleotidyltransferase (CCA-adding enzyme)
MRGYIDPSKIPFKVLAIASALRDSGGNPLIVGGPVRDVLLGKQPLDWDIAVNMDPHQVLRVFPGACTVGIEYGRVSVGDVDVVSLRAEKDYHDKRHPSQVMFGVPLEKDLERRDFTINAMAWDPFTGEIFDPFGGLNDLERRALVCVGLASERFEEDPLRILRAVRLKTCLGLNLDAELVEAIRACKGLLSQLPGERVFAEVKRILVSPSAYQGIVDLYEYGISAVVLPEVDKAPNQAAVGISVCQPDLATRLGVLLGDNRN